MQSIYKCIAIVSLLTLVAGVATAAEASALPDSQLVAALKAKLEEEAAADSFSGAVLVAKKGPTHETESIPLTEYFPFRELILTLPATLGGQ